MRQVEPQRLFFYCRHLCSEEASGRILCSDTDTEQMLQRAGLVPGVCLYEKYAPWISLASGGGWVLVGPQGDSVSAGDSSSFCQSSSWFCNANEAHGFTLGLSVLMTKPLQA